MDFDESVLRRRCSMLLLFFLVLVVMMENAFAFAPSTGKPLVAARANRVWNAASLSELGEQGHSYVLSREEVNPIVTFGEGSKEKIVNPFGLRALAVSLFTGPIWMVAMFIVDKVSKMNESWDPNHAIFDATGKVWAKTWLGMTDSLPTFSGEIDTLRSGHGPCLYVANHASWLDIPVLCTVLDPVFKFIAKKELEKVPCIGQQLAGGEHILIDRDDRRSQLRTFKAGVEWLKKGVPLMAFPEGMRSPDGRLMEFKGGIFSMATKTKVPIVPISISHTHAIMPGNALFPVQPGNGKLHVHVHPPIDVTDKTEQELGELVKAALLSEIPFDQHPLAKEGSLETPAEEEAAKGELIAA